jgi:hypothetical protein
MHGCLPLALPCLVGYPFLPQWPSKLRRVRLPSTIPHLQGWPLNPPPSFLPPMSPIAHQTRSCSNAPLALFAGCHPYHEGIAYHIPTAKSTCAPEEPLGFAGLCQAFSMVPKEANGFAYLCAALEKVDSPSTLSVLDPTTGEFLEHRQL